MSILINNKQEHLGMRQQGGMFTGVVGPVSSVIISIGSDPTRLGKWNWVQLKSRSNSMHLIYTC